MHQHGSKVAATNAHAGADFSDLTDFPTRVCQPVPRRHRGNSITTHPPVPTTMIFNKDGHTTRPVWALPKTELGNLPVIVLGAVPGLARRFAGK